MSTPGDFARALVALPPHRIGALRREGALGTDPLAAEVPAGMEDAAAVVAHLYATTRAHFGDVLPLATIAARVDAGERGLGIERRFGEALVADLDRVERYLAPIVKHGHAAGMSPRWGVLLADLAAWGEADRPVQRRWAREFWATDQPDAEPARDELRTQEVAALLGITRARVAQLIGEGTLPSHKRGRDRFVRREDAEALRDRKRTPGPARRTTAAE